MFKTHPELRMRMARDFCRQNNLKDMRDLKRMSRTQIYEQLGKPDAKVSENQVGWIETLPGHKPNYWVIRFDGERVIETWGGDLNPAHRNRREPVR